MKLLVLAAGLGSRFGGVKQIAAVGPAGETILEYTIYNALSAGFDSVVFLIRKEIEADFAASVLSRLPSSIPVEIACQSMEDLVPPSLLPTVLREGRQKPWGTGHALLCAQACLRSAPFVVLNGDDFYGSSCFQALWKTLSGTGEYCFPAYQLDKVISAHGSVSRAVCEIGQGGYLKKIVEHRHIEVKNGEIVSLADGSAPHVLNPTLPISMNMWGLRPDIFPRAQRLFTAFLESETNRKSAEFYLPAIIADVVAEGISPVRALPVQEGYFGLTNSADLLEARQAIAKAVSEGRYPAPLWAKA